MTASDKLLHFRVSLSWPVSPSDAVWLQGPGPGKTYCFHLAIWRCCSASMEESLRKSTRTSWERRRKGMRGGGQGEGETTGTHFSYHPRELSAACSPGIPDCNTRGHHWPGTMSSRGHIFWDRAVETRPMCNTPGSQGDWLSHSQEEAGLGSELWLTGWLHSSPKWQRLPSEPHTQHTALRVSIICGKSQKMT